MTIFRSLIVGALAVASLEISAPAEAHAEVRPVARGTVSVQPQVRYRRAPGPRVMLPLKIDLGMSGGNTRFGFAPGVSGAIGVHWASMSPRPTNTDIGVGLFGSILSAPASASAAMDENTGVFFGGPYVEVGRVLSQGDFWRTWVAGRGEYVISDAFDESKRSLGATVRLSAELFASGVGIEPRGVFLGSYGVGLYVEASARDMVDGVGVMQATAGMTFRTPTVFRFF